MMQQMAAMAGEGGGGAGGMPGFPRMPNMPGQQPAVAVVPDTSENIWRFVHTVFALALAFYISFTTSFSGTKIERERSAVSRVVGNETDSNGLSPDIIHFFWIFATAQVVLQSTRFFMDKGKTQPAGVMGMVVKFLPQPWQGYIGMLKRYMRIWTQISGDAIICVFVLGASAWLKGN